ncbi:zinc finger CCCH domain-containing protein 53-like [Amaranthus tricolor]|uniref:zinc finger CCCH domain-containing protein 53-like n=1 Tax=Amaranthus tricolor TaxID=29722 RepID=UPI002588F4E4|nr:zinc finger CCCH domain-containing protein 53-like [Amaranthus tricolor]XP_057541035.1 zinc finger CCCH domain-containing protein 53-like [Amaranthus tricolor]XP_057541036.1 zinc finger CCCH domain-containing protein 53-like [Amaranthus tricolor]
MDPYEATKVVFSKVQSLDPANASKIMGLLLVQDHGEKEMIRLAFGPENLLHSVVVKARQELGIFPNTPCTPSTPSSPSPFLPNNTNNNNIFSRQTSSSSSRFLKIPTSLALPTLASPSSTSSPSWGTSVFPDFNQKSDDLISPISSSSANNNSSSFGTMSSTTTTANSSTLNPSTPPFYATSTRNSSLGINGVSELMDDVQLQEHLSFLNENSPTLRPKSTDLYFPHAELELGGGVSDFNHHGVPRTASSAWGENGNGLPHRRSCSVSDISMASLLDDPASGLGWKPCVYYARGFCKNGSSCRFVHGGGMLSESEAAALVGSPSKLEMMEHCHELLRSKSMQQQKLLAAAIASASASASSSASAASFPYSLNKGLSLFAQQQQNDSPRAAAAAAAAMLMSEDLHKFSRSPRGLDNGRGDSNPASRQIYLTFPADSTFREEDVSNYFSIYGPVQDVRIPYQQKRMFGFVTFVYPETVKIILAKGNPHFVCDARVLVKPYKEKGKVPDKLRKQQQQQMERGDFSACNSPTALDSRDPFDLPLGTRSMMYDTQTQYILWRRKLEEQTDLQQALELQSRRLMGLQLLDVKRTLHHRSLSTGAPPIHSPIQSPNSIFNQPLLSSDRSSPDASDENCASPPLNEAKQALQQAINEAIAREKESSVGGEDNSNNCNAKENPCHEDNLINLPESLEHNLPDSPFASPKKVGREYLTSFSNNAALGEDGVEELSNLAPTSAESKSKASPFHSATATLDMTPFKSSCYFQMPRFSPGHGAIGM